METNDKDRRRSRWARRSVGSVHGKLVHSRRVRVLARHFSELIPHGHSVLDVGCGDGLIDALILKNRPDLTISGVDVLRRANTHIPVTLFDGKSLPFADQSRDTVLFCDVLHHTDTPVDLLKEAVRVARHSLVIKDHTVQGFLASPTLRLMDYLGNAPHGIVLPYNYLSPRQWVEAWQACSLVPGEVRRDLKIYPPLADAFFGRTLHFAGLYYVAPCLSRLSGITSAPTY
jgi:SAM-dependent methyltransferase